MSRNIASKEVYHVTTNERAESCANMGIIPSYSSEQSSKTLELDEYYDSLRPNSVSATRRNSVYAHPDIDFAVVRNNGGWLSRTEQGLAVITIQLTNLEESYVADGLLNTPPHRPQDYWPSCVTLASYLRQEIPTYSGPSFFNPAPRKRVYSWPEVLIPRKVDAQEIVDIRFDAT